MDITQAVRRLFKHPGLTLLITVTFGLGIGANAAMFSVINTLMFKPLPVRDTDRVVVLASVDRHSSSPHGMYYQDVSYYMENADAFEHLSAVMAASVDINDGQQPLRIRSEVVSSNYFVMLGIDAERGRVFLPEKGDLLDAEPVIVITHGLWLREFGGDPSAVGRTIRLNGYPVTIIGVLPQSFVGSRPLMPVEAVFPIGIATRVFQRADELLNKREAENFKPMARLKQGISPREASNQLNLIASRLAEQFPLTNKGASVTVVPENHARPDPEIGALLPKVAVVFMIIVGMVLAIACANIVTLILSQIASRQKEFAIRVTLGASRWRVARQVLVEIMILALLGGGAGILLSKWAAQLLGSIRFQTAYPMDVTPSVDWRVLVFSLCITALLGLSAGLIPAIQASRADVSEKLKESGRSVSGSRVLRRFRTFLVVSQVAVSLALLVCGWLFIESLNNSKKIPLGFRSKDVFLASINVGSQGYSQRMGKQFYSELSNRLRDLSGVESASLTEFIPLGFYKGRMSVIADGAAVPPDEAEGVGVYYNAVGPEYFKTVDTLIKIGRDFTASDNDKSQKVAIVSEAMAAKFWPNDVAVGKRFKADMNFYTVVGVAGDIKYDWIYGAARPMFYIPLDQSYTPIVNLFVRTNVDPASVSRSIHHLVASLDPELTLYDITTMADHIEYGPALLPARLGAILTTTFGVLGIVLAATGVYGVISYLVSQRVHEIGVRTALGASRGSVLRLLVGRSMISVTLGIMTGALIALALTRLVSGLLFGVGWIDPAAYAVSIGFIVTISLIASYLPAHRASKVDPMVALRSE